MSNELKPCIHAEVCTTAEFCELEFGEPCNHYRAERTCHPVRRSGKSFSEEEKKTTLDACCSECRGFLGEAWEVFECDRDLFCSGCGAKVVE